MVTYSLRSRLSSALAGWLLTIVLAHYILESTYPLDIYLIRWRPSNSFYDIFRRSDEKSGDFLPCKRVYDLNEELVTEGPYM